jgi:hypothetical protein
MSAASLTMSVDGWILLQKSSWGGERKFLEPLMRFAHGDARDHIASSKIDHGSPVALKSNGAAEKSKDRLSRDFQGCSIFDFCNKIRQKRPLAENWGDDHGTRA